MSISSVQYTYTDGIMTILVNVRKVIHTFTKVIEVGLELDEIMEDLDEGPVNYDDLAGTLLDSGYELS